MNQSTKSKIWHIKHDRQVEYITYWGTVVLGGIIGFVLFFTLIDLLLIAQNKIL